MEDQDLLKALEDAYQRGVSLEQIQTALSENPDVEEDALEIAQEFYSKKKDSTDGLQEESLSVSESELVPDSTESVSSPVEYDADFLLRDGLAALSSAYDRGVNISQIEEKFQGNPEFVQLAKDYYQTLDSRVWEDEDTESMGIIVDDNPNMLGRLWNRGAASGRLASEIAKGETTGDVNWENIAYLNSIMQRDGVKKTGEENPVLDFAGDVVRAIPESLISMFTGIESGLAGAAAGAAATAPIGGVGAVPGFFGASSLALEYAHSMMDVIREEGIDITDGDQLAFAFENEELMSRAREKGLKRGIPIAIFDAISGGVAGKVGTNVVKSVGKSATNRAAKVLAAETLVQAGLGGTGEFAGQVISGDEISPRDIALEAFAELGPAAPVMAYNLTGRINATPGELEWKDWASSVEDQKEVVTAQNVADKVGKINELNNKIDQVRAEDVSGTEARKTKRELIRKLKDEKYREKTKIAKQFMELNEEDRALAELTSNTIDKDAKSIKDNPNASNVNEAIKQRIKENIEILNGLLGQPKEETTTQQEITDDQETLSEKVPGDIEAGQEPGRVPDAETSEAQTSASRILQEREQQEVDSRFADPEQAYQTLLSDSAAQALALNLFDPNEAAALRRFMDEGKYRPGQRKYLENLVLASEAYKKMFPEAKVFALGFGDRGYQRAGMIGGFRSVKGSAGITNPSTKNVAINIPRTSQYYGEGQSRGPNDRFTGIQTAYHEMFHNVLRNHFAQNKADYNQLRKLVTRRLSESDVQDLNEFAKRYDPDATTATLPSEEFMVQLGGLLANKNIQFQPTFLEELKAFIGNIVSKITGGKLQFFEDAVLANDIANYMKGTSEAMRMGEDVSAVAVPERLRTERFERTPREAIFDADDTMVEEREPMNKAGLPDPENYEKTFTPVEKLLRSLNKGTVEGIRKLESKIGRPLLRARKEILQALEISQSVNVPHLNNLTIRLTMIGKAMKKLTADQQQEVRDLSGTYLFDEKADARAAAFEELEKSYPNIAVEVGRLKSLRDFYQDAFQNSEIYDVLDQELLNVIKDNRAFYGTRTYRAFTDSEFKFDKDLQKAAAKSLVELNIEDEFFALMDELTDAPMGLTIMARMRESKLKVKELKDIKKYQKSKANVEGLSVEEIQTAIDSGLIAEDMNAQGFSNYQDDGQVLEYVERTKRSQIESEVKAYIKKLKKTADEVSGRKTSNGLVGDTKLGPLRVPTKKFKTRNDLPLDLRTFLGEETDPFIKFSTTIGTLSRIYAQYGLVSNVNKAAQRAGVGDIAMPPAVYNAILKDNFVQQPNGEPLFVFPREVTPLSARNQKELLTNARNMGAMKPEETPREFYDRIGIKYTEKFQQQRDGSSVDGIVEPTSISDFRELNDYLKDYFEENYTIVQDKQSPIQGQAVNKEFVEVLKDTPLYNTDSNNKAWNAYVKILLQMRRVRVLYNIPTWRKNIMGGWYFLAANGILPFGENLGGYNIMKDMKVRLSKMKKGEYDPVTQQLVNEVAELGLLGSSINASLLTDINQSFFEQMNGERADNAWGWLQKANAKSKRLAYQYGAIDDYTKIVMYAAKRENFAKRLSSNPEGKSYSELSDVQQQEVREMVAERVKQNMPTMSRIHPSFRMLFSSPFGDFLSFRVEAFRSFLSIYRNAVNDLREGFTNDSLSPSQKQAYITDSIKALITGSAMAGASAIGYQMLADLITGRDEEEEELAMAARGTNLILPPWMQGANIIPIKMEKNGDIRYVNMSSEDPYDEIQGLIYGRKGVTRYDNLMSILSDFKDPNMAIKLLFNLVQGKNQYGEEIVKSDDLNWFNRNLIPTGYTHWDETLGTYALKEVFVPPNISFIERQLRQRAKQLERDPDAEMEPLNAIALATNVVFRDYPVNISKQFYYNMSDQNFKEPYMDMEEGSSRRKNRKARLDEVKRAYEFAIAYSDKYSNPKIVQDFERTIKSTFRKSKDEQRYILYDIELPE